jgi:hypothetical protein
MSKRKDFRVQMNRQIALQGSRGASQGIVRDFSPAGCCIHQADANVHCGMRLTVRISLPDRIEPLEIKPAIVTWAHNNVFGVEFLFLSQDARWRLKQVYDQLLEAETAEDTERMISLPAFVWR